jgi:hypothetical protein
VGRDHTYGVGGVVGCIDWVDDLLVVDELVV